MFWCARWLILVQVHNYLMRSLWQFGIFQYLRPLVLWAWTFNQVPTDLQVGSQMYSEHCRERDQLEQTGSWTNTDEHMKVVMEKSARVMLQDSLVKDFSLGTVCYLAQLTFSASIILHFFLVIKDRLIAKRGILVLIILLSATWVGNCSFSFISSPFVSPCLLYPF